MKRKHLPLIIISLLCSCNEKSVDENRGWNIASESYCVDDCLDNVSNKECKVILLYGQSNATGYSNSSYVKNYDQSLYDLYCDGFNNVKINYVHEGNSMLTENTFVDLCFNNTNLGNTFGPEMGIGEQYSKIFPTDDIFIIKYAWGGSSLENEWLTYQNNRNTMYNNAINFTKTSLDYLKSVGYTIHIEGISWMQGESDSSDGLYDKYYDNLKTLVEYFRKDLKQYQKTIKFIDAYIEDIDAWKYYKEINKQKEDHCNLNKNNYLIDTISLGLTTSEEPFGKPDLYHYDSMSMVSLGREFANVMINNKEV